MRKTGIVLTVVGVLLIAAAAVLRFVIVPNQSQLPSDTNKTQHYSGTASVILNPTALTTGDLAALFLRNVPITVDRTVKVTQTQGQDAIANDARSVKAASGAQLSKLDYNFAVDRKTLEPVPAFGGAQVTAAKGLTFSFPFGTDKKDYTGYVVETQGTATLKYSGEVKQNGLNTYVFKASVPATKMTEPKELEGMPTVLPKNLLASLPKALGYSDAQAAQFTQLLTAMPAMVPITYLFSGTSTYWVAPTTGLVVNTSETKTRQAVIEVPGQAQPVPLGTVASVSYNQTPASVADFVSDAKDADSTLSLFGTTLPLIGLIVGVVLVGVGIVMWLRRPPAGPALPTHEDITPTTTA